ncbi:MAG: RHS repeat protein [Kofleriaceae bacterium]|nr:RHS repeat protein [Kofleriaceae bacterium]MBP9172252.1 RHS repeat protein [Kofleriaceae bacterium]MBP9861083.1 RHS repeat protein [Kofleriaceae bacterium]
MTRRTYADGRLVDATYTADGQVAEERETLGATVRSTTRTYDAVGRLASIAYPDAIRLDFQYDAGGNRTAVTTTTASGDATVTYAYDELNRMAAVARGAAVHQYAYDAAGQLTRLTRPNGTSTDYGYDVRGRAASLAARGPGGAARSWPGLGGHAVQVGCGSCADEERQMSENDDGLKGVQSGYVGTVQDWRRFLSCWYRNPGRRGPMLITRDPLADAEALTAAESEYRLAIAARESYLNVTLPKSYVDFLLAYQPGEVYGDGKRLVSAAVLDTLGAVQPAYVQEVQREAGEFTIADHRYYVYGASQDDATSRARYLEKSLCLGYHGYDLFEIIALHPQVRTMDDEMEAELYYYAGSVRATNFAKLMHYVYEYDVLGSISSGRTAPGACASLLPAGPY